MKLRFLPYRVHSELSFDILFLMKEKIRNNDKNMKNMIESVVMVVFRETHKYVIVLIIK